MAASIQRATKKLSYVLHFHRHIGRAGVWIGDLFLNNSCTIRHSHERPDHDRISGGFSSSMDNILGLLRIRIKRGVNLVVRDAVSNTSDPYVVVTSGDQKLKTRIVKKDCNPVWNDDLTLSVSDATTPIVLTVYDKDTLSGDDRMGDAEFELKPYLDCLNMGLENLPTPTTISRVQATRNNCLADESVIVWQDGKIVQDMILRLRNVESGEIELQIEWIKIPPRS